MQLFSALATDAQRALTEMNGKPVNGRKVKIEMAKPRVRGKRQRDSDETPHEGADGAAEDAPAPVKPTKEMLVKKRARKWRLIVRNLSFKVMLMIPVQNIECTVHRGTTA